MSGATNYRIVVADGSACYVQLIDSVTGQCLMYCGEAKRAKCIVGRVESERLAQLLAAWLVQSGYPKAASKVRIVPAAGGARTGWRPNLEKQSVRTIQAGEYAGAGGAERAV